jgi:transmembrane sensor
MYSTFINSSFLFIQMKPPFARVEDFLAYRLFRDWVHTPSPPLDQRWATYFERWPETKDAASEAKAILLSIHTSVEADFPDNEKITRMFDGIRTENLRPKKKQKPLRRSLLWFAAACLSGLLLWKAPFSPKQKYSEVDPFAHLEGRFIEQHNSSSVTRTVVLPDSSKVHLNPGSNLRYPASFNCYGKREIQLEGSAYFEVERDTSAPFLVYAQEVITKVLGTSFRIHSEPEHDVLTVAVVTGQVLVTTDPSVNATNGQALHLTPNQQARFTRKHPSLTKSLVANPTLLPAYKDKSAFEFDDVSAATVFRTIEKFYGVGISYDEEKLGDCLLTASLSEESLFEMLDLLCTALDARYTVEGTEIIVSGRGCR